MSLRYSFRHLFYGGNIHKDRLYKVLQDLDSANTGESTDIGALETIVGDEDGGLVKDVADIKTAIGTATGETPSGLAHDVDDLGDYIAEILTANSLTDPRAETQSEPPSTEPSG